MTFPKNLEYMVELFWDGKCGADIHIRGIPRLKLDMPVKFGGKGRSPCPDELFSSALGGCLLTTFPHFKDRLKLDLQGAKDLRPRKAESYQSKRV